MSVGEGTRLPEKIGKHRIVERIGRGGMGMIFKAHDPILDRLVAVKVISPEVEVTDELRARFFREAQACAKLNHPNIVTVYEMGEDEGRLFIVMELLEGEELRQLIKASPALTLKEKLSVMLQVCSGLHYAHQKGIVHRDMKPGNVFLLRNGQVKILDFGIAHIATTEAGLTRTGLIMGTLRYISPEQVRGRADHRSDMFSVGSVFYELLTARPPFLGADPMQLLEQLRTEDPPSPTQIDPTIPPELAAIVERAMRKDPSDRFQDLGQMQAQLQAVQRALQDETQRAFPRYLAPAIIERLASEPSALKLGGERREVTVMFADLSGFGPLAGRVEPEVLTSLTNRYLGFIVEQVDATGGYVDKFIGGDAVMAIWGAPAPDTSHAANGVRAALAAVRRIRLERDAAKVRGETGLSVQIGLNSGPAVVGNLGTEHRFNYTAVGETVNIGSRLERVPSLYGCQVVIGPRTAELVGGEYLIRELDWIQVKSGQGPITVFEPIVGLSQATPEQIDRTRRFAEALAHYRDQRFVDAFAIWDSLAQEEHGESKGSGPKDGPRAGPPVKMAARAREFADRPPLPPWDGVWVLPSGSSSASDSSLKALEAFLGTWVGKWGTLDTTLVVQKIEFPFATTFYEWGSDPARNLSAGGAYEIGRFGEDGNLTITWTNGAVLTVRMNTNGSLAGTYQFQGGTIRATLVRKP